MGLKGVRSPLSCYPLSEQLRLFLESGSHEAHISCGLEGDPIPRQRGGQEGPEPDEDPAGPQGRLQVVARAQVIRVLAPSPLPRGLAPQQQHPVEEQPSPAQQCTCHTRVGHKGQGKLRQRHSACKEKARGSGGSRGPSPPKAQLLPLSHSLPSTTKQGTLLCSANAEQLLPGEPRPVTWADTAPCPTSNLHSSQTCEHLPRARHGGRHRMNGGHQL